MVLGLGVLQADFPGIADRVDAVIQVVVQSDDVLPGAVVLGARRDVQVLDDVVILLDGVLRALGNIGEILAGGAILFQIAAVESLSACADLAVEIFEQIVVFAQSAVEVLLGERRFAAILVVIVIIVVQAVGIAEGLKVIVIIVVVRLGCLCSRLRGGVVERFDHKEDDQGDDDCHQHNDNGDKRAGAALFGSWGLWRSGRVCRRRLLLGRAARNGHALRRFDRRGAGGGVGAIGERIVRFGLRRIEGAGLLKSGLVIARGRLLNGCTARGAELGVVCKKLTARGAVPRHCHSFRHISMQYDDYTQRPKLPIISCGEIGSVWRPQGYNQSLFHRNLSSRWGRS